MVIIKVIEERRRSIEEITRVSLNRLISSEVWLNLIKSNFKLDSGEELFELELTNCLLKLLKLKEEEEEEIITINSNLILNYFNLIIKTKIIKINNLIRIIILNQQTYSLSLSLISLDLLFNLINNNNNNNNTNFTTSLTNSSFKLKSSSNELDEDLNLLNFIIFSSEIIIKSLENNNKNNKNQSTLSLSPTLNWILNFLIFYSKSPNKFLFHQGTLILQETKTNLNLAKDLLITTINSTSTSSSSSTTTTTTTTTTTKPFLIQLLNVLPSISSPTSNNEQISNVDSLNSDSSIEISKLPRTTTEEVELNFVQPDIQFLIVDLMTRRTTPSGISNLSYSVLQIQSLIQTRVHLTFSNPSSSSTSTTSIETVVTQSLFEILLVFWDESRRNNELLGGLYEIGLVSRLPEILKLIFEKNFFKSFHSSTEEASTSLQISQCLVNALKRLKSCRLEGSISASEKDSQLCERILNVYSSRKFSLLPTRDAESLSNYPNQVLKDESFPINLQTESIQSLLKRLSNPSESPRPLVDAIKSLIITFSKTYNLPALAEACTLLLEGTNLEMLFLFLEPRGILRPIRAFLDSIDTTLDRFGEGHAVEKYGTVAHFLLVVMSRFDLYPHQTYHLSGPPSNFTTQWLPSLSSTYALPSLDPESLLVIHNWIRDLFGEGISDELIQSTDPRVLLRVAPTICKQSLGACLQGVMDEEMLREGLGYLLNGVLNFTLPGVLLWLIGEIERVGINSPAQILMINLLQLFIFSESLPLNVLEIISPTLKKLILNLQSTTSTSTSNFSNSLTSPGSISASGGTTIGTNGTLDVEKIKFLIEPFCKPSTLTTTTTTTTTTTLNNLSQVIVGENETWLQRLSKEITFILLLDPSPTSSSSSDSTSGSGSGASSVRSKSSSPNLSLTLFKSLNFYSDHSVVLIIFETLLNNILPLSSSTNNDESLEGDIEDDKEMKVDIDIPKIKLSNLVKEVQFKRRLNRIKSLGRSLLGINELISIDSSVSDHEAVVVEGEREREGEEGMGKRKENRRFNLLESTSRDYLINNFGNELFISSQFRSSRPRGGGTLVQQEKEEEEEEEEEEEIELEKIKIELILSILESSFYTAENLEKDLLGQGNEVNKRISSSSSRIKLLRDELGENFKRFRVRVVNFGIHSSEVTSTTTNSSEDGLNLFVNGILNRVAFPSSTIGIGNTQSYAFEKGEEMILE